MWCMTIINRNSLCRLCITRVCWQHTTNYSLGLLRSGNIFSLYVMVLHFSSFIIPPGQWWLSLHVVTAPMAFWFLGSISSEYRIIESGCSEMAGKRVWATHRLCSKACLPLALARMQTWESSSTHLQQENNRSIAASNCDYYVECNGSNHCSPVQSR